MTNEIWGVVGVAITALAAFAVAVRQSRSTDRSTDRTATADEVRSLGERLDKQADRMDRQDERISHQQRELRGLRAYIAEDHAEHLRRGWPITPLPEELQ